ncbi:MAG TPA: LacI family DNA-binding transcriptional regulator [Thermoanaerobaculia bacterium]|nr:LacI family DNA-binding transcriptional regulator [Thermoanaerobaculia bacterium]
MDRPPPPHPSSAPLPPGGSREVSIRDVARAAGVSVTTVSRVLNATGPVAEETRGRVTAAVELLDYVPHGGARSLITRRTETIGVLLPDLYGEFFSELIRGMDQTARLQRFHVLVSSAHSGRAEVEEVLRALRGRVDGLIVMSPDVDVAPALARYGETLPMVLLDAEAGRLDAITIDNYGGACSMMRHLVGLGHRRIALLAGPARNLDARERARGWRDSLGEAGLPAPPELCFAGDFAEASGHEAGAWLAALARRPTAVFTANDSMAVGLLSALREIGLRVPEDVALGGFDDIPIARYLSPPLTTVRVPIAELGSRAMQRVLSLLESREPAHRHEVVPTQLVVRASCGAPAARTSTDPTIGG